MLLLAAAAPPAAAAAAVAAAGGAAGAAAAAVGWWWCVSCCCCCCCRACSCLAAAASSGLCFCCCFVVTCASTSLYCLCVTQINCRNCIHTTPPAQHTRHSTTCMQTSVRQWWVQRNCPVRCAQASACAGCCWQSQKNSDSGAWKGPHRCQEQVPAAVS